MMYGAIYIKIIRTQYIDNVLCPSVIDNLTSNIKLIAGINLFLNDRYPRIAT
jgi:hypothetical protein